MNAISRYLGRYPGQEAYKIAGCSPKPLNFFRIILHQLLKTETQQWSHGYILWERWNYNQRVTVLACV
jgi:hypothetical protein